MLPFFFQGDVHQALIVLQKGVELCFPENETPPEGKNMLIHGRATLLVGRFMEETANFESNAVMKKYKVSVCIMQFLTFLLFLKIEKLF